MGKIRSDATPVGDRIMGALEDARWDWRTVDGISRDTGIPPDEVRGFLARGRALFTTRKRYRESHSLMERLLDHYRITAT